MSELLLDTYWVCLVLLELTFQQNSGKASGQASVPSLPSVPGPQGFPGMWEYQC